MTKQGAVRTIATLASSVLALALAFALGRWSARGEAAQTAATTDRRDGTLRASPGFVQPSDELIDTWSTSELRVQYKQLIERERAQAAELTSLRAVAAGAPVSTAQATPASAGPQPSAATASQDAKAKPAPFANPLKAQFYPADPAELTELAKHCSARVDEPPVMDSTPGELDNVEEKLGASPSEERVLKRALAELHTSLRARLRTLYEESVGHPPAPELSSRALISEIQDKTPPANRQGLIGRIARERAGEAPPPQNLAEFSPYERATRITLEVGDEYQTLLARELRAPRAHELRSQQGGWPWSRSQFTGCE